MSELGDKIERVRASIRPDWSEARAREAWRGIKRRERRRSTVRSGVAMVAGAALLASLGLGVGGLLVSRHQPPALTLQLGDGSIITPLDTSSVVQMGAAVPGRTLIRLARGGARFEVT